MNDVAIGEDPMVFDVQLTFQLSTAGKNFSMQWKLMKLTSIQLNGDLYQGNIQVQLWKLIIIVVTRLENLNWVNFIQTYHHISIT